MTVPPRSDAPPAPTGRVSCTAERACLPRLLALIDDACERHGVDAQTGHDLRLIVEEACVNVMDYAYPPGRPGPLTLQIEALTEGTRSAIVISLEDQGMPFDPLALPPPDQNAALEAMPVGGLGVHLIRELSDVQHYRRDPERGNVFTISKYLVPQQHT